MFNFRPVITSPPPILKTDQRRWYEVTHLIKYTHCTGVQYLYIDLRIDITYLKHTTPFSLMQILYTDR